MLMPALLMPVLLMPVLAATAPLVMAATQASADDAFTLPTRGCPMAHCDPAMTDMNPTPAPSPAAPGGPVLRWRDPRPGGSKFGLGCVSNGSRIACSYQDSVDALVVYDLAGKRLWTSGQQLSSSAWTSAPTISADGEVIAADSSAVVRFRADGSLRWRTAITGGPPISPVVSPRGDAVLVATQGGPIHLLDPSTGTLLATLVVRTSPADSGNFFTVNTPAFRGNRAYVAMQYRASNGTNPTNLAWLVAVNVDPANQRRGQRLTTAWHFEYGSPGGASPLVIGNRIYLDGAALSPYPGQPPASSVLFCVQDQSATPSLLWAQPLPGKVAASPARDPRAGLWTFSTGTADSRLLRFDESTGALMQTIDLAGLTPGVTRFVSSALSIAASTSTTPTLLVGARNSPTLAGTTRVELLNLDLTTGQLAWGYVLADATTFTAGLYGQFAVAGDPADPLVVFSGYRQGAIALGT